MDINHDIILLYAQKMNDFEKEAHILLSIHETSKKSRVILLSDSFKKLDMLSIKEKILFHEALQCVEQEFYRSAIILSWVGFMHFVLEKIEDFGLQNISLKKTSWNYKTIEELTEKQTEFSIIELLFDIGYCSKTEKKALQGLLNKRNECAHPSSHTPDINETLGYISELFKRISQIQSRIH
ncbi:MAG: hypothetical protein ABSG28_08460 [Methanoregula sp.]|jgi:hypothetical protein|uniref:hypothetical protein n=1 Tax=Methanoregula sp. TaxID=2052170 RepID=UPI003C21F2D5